MPRQSDEVRGHLQKARESALLAVETYNRPGTVFRSGGYIVLMCIAWTALLHAIFFARKVKPFYRSKKNKRHFEKRDGDRRAWELKEAASQFWKGNNPPERANLEFFVRLRNKIEHRSMPELDVQIFGECQALLFNFENLLVAEFGEKQAINESLSLALQFSAFRDSQQQKASRKLHSRLAGDVKKYVDDFRSSLSLDTLQNANYSYKVFVIPKPANSISGSDVAVDFVKYDTNRPADMDRVQRALTLLKPMQADADAPRAYLNFNDTHRLSQKAVLEELNRQFRMSPKVNSHDMQCLKVAHGLTERADFYHKPLLGAPQYSEAFRSWLINEFHVNPFLFKRAREEWRKRREETASVNRPANVD